MSIIENFNIGNEDYKHRNSIYVIGGASKSKKPLSILRYDIGENKWYDINLEHDMIKGGAIMLHSGNIALIGGKNVRIKSTHSIIEKRRAPPHLRVQSGRQPNHLRDEQVQVLISVGLQRDPGRELLLCSGRK